MDLFNGFARVLYWLATVIGLIVVVIRYANKSLWYLNSQCLGVKQLVGLFVLKLVVAIISLRILNFYFAYIVGIVLRVLLYLLLIRIAATRDLDPDADAKPPIVPVAMPMHPYYGYQPVAGY